MLRQVSREAKAARRRAHRSGWIVRVTVAAGGLSIMLGCAASVPSAYERSRAAAERAYVHGRYEEAARRWLVAARRAERLRDRNEARYRAAVSLRRAGRHAAAAKLFADLARSPDNERAARAAFDRAKLEIDRGSEARGHELLGRAIAEYPDSGLAPAALRRHVRYLHAHGGHAAVFAYLDQALAQLDGSELSEYLHYEYARALEKSGQVRAALARYLQVARRFDYPHGALWDDSLWHASRLEEQRGDYRAAVGHLRRMLAEREPPSSPGTYNRPRYDDAQFRIAELYRDRLGDAGSARREFLALFTRHPDSPLRDDALWSAALVARSEGDTEAVCDALRPLVEDLPHSRFAPCAKKLCPELPKIAGRTCRDYIQRELGDSAE
jgi:tetratricopeptide (TPR) repeat protein